MSDNYLNHLNKCISICENEIKEAQEYLASGVVEFDKIEFMKDLLESHKEELPGLKRRLAIHLKKRGMG